MRGFLFEYLDVLCWDLYCYTDLAEVEPGFRGFDLVGFDIVVQA